MSITKTSQGTYKANFTVNNRRIIKTFSDRKTAKEFEAQTRARLIAAANDQSLGRYTSRQFTEALQRWIPTSPQSMQDHVAIVITQFPPCSLTEAPEAAQHFKEAMQARGLANATINRRLAVIKRVLNVAYKQYKWLQHPVASQIELLPENNERNIFRTADHIFNLAAACPSLPERKAILIAAFMGLRRGEILLLTPSNIVGNILYLFTSKSGKPRSIPIPIFLLDVFDELPLQITKRSIRTNFDKARLAVNDPNLKFHDLRHVYAGLLASSSKVSLTQIRDLLGHTSIKTTNRYLYLMQDFGGALDVINSYNTTTDIDAPTDKIIK